MSNIINIKCKIEGCNDYHEYKFDLKLPKAIDAKWLNNDCDKKAVHILLEDIPCIGSNYEIVISTPIKLDLNNHFWILYMSPNGSLNGIESQRDIESMRFCLCRSIQVLDNKDTSVEIRVKVLDTMSLDEPTISQFDNHPAYTILDDFRLGKEYCIEKYDTYSLISINVQSDFGWDFIIKNNKNRYTIVAQYSWSPHKYIWEKANLVLSDNQVDKYGLTKN